MSSWIWGDLGGVVDLEWPRDMVYINGEKLAWYLKKF